MAALLNDTELQVALDSLGTDWQLVAVGTMTALQRRWTTKNFADAFALSAKVAELADGHDHHPLMQVEWGAFTVTWWTHSSGGITMLDLTLAKLCNSL